MTRPEFISRRGKPPIQVERKRKRKFASAWSRRDVHALGLAAVADEIDLAAMLDMGGIMTGERRAMMAERRVGRFDYRVNDRVNSTRMLVSDRASNAAEKRDIGCATPEATGPEIPADPSTTGLLADDVSRNIWAERGRFAPILWGEMR